jgi:hypothetical protein
MVGYVFGPTLQIWVSVVVLLLVAPYPSRTILGYSSGKTPLPRVFCIWLWAFNEGACTEKTGVSKWGIK